MSDTEIMKLEHKINGILALTGNKENITILLHRQRIKYLTLKLNVAL
ncbi:MAG: hypothetical protein KZQ83_00575 [gamma proteobacterium symbiont of Taylorina sp.]|nr:hypothetical protein [gamma proteobacterium symbiont of Taylorina sp.]